MTNAAGRSARFLRSAYFVCHGSVPKRLGGAFCLIFFVLAGSLFAQTNQTTQANEDVGAPTSLKKLSIEDLMNVEVTSVSKSPQKLSDAAAAIQVVSGEQIRRSGASSIPEALRLADNLDVAQVSSSGWDISARGFNSSVSDKLLVLMDGRTIYTPLFGGVIWNMQDYLLADIDRIEAISGPGGTLWGANAVNGVINIISKSAEDTQGLYMEGGGGSQLQDFVGVRYGGAVTSNVFYRVYGKFFNRGPEEYDDGTSAHDDWNRGQGGFRMDAEGSADDHFTLQGDIYGGSTGTIPDGEDTPRAQGYGSGGNVIGRWTHTFSEDNDLTLQLYYDRTHLEAPFPPGPAEPAFPPFFPASPAVPAGTLEDNLDTADMDFQDRFHLGERNHIVWGLGYRYTHDEVGNTPVVTFLPATLDRNLYSGFIQDEIRLWDHVFLTLGSKLEHNDYTGYEYEPSGRVRWNITDNQMIWAAVSRAVRDPTRYDTSLFEPNPNLVYIFHLIGNPNFKSEKVLAYELGYRAIITPKVSGSVSAFYNLYSDLRSESAQIVDTSTALINVDYHNNLSAITYGLEVSSDYQALDWWRLHAGYDLLMEHIQVGAGGDQNDGLFETADPKNQVFLRSSMDLPGRTELDANFRWIDAVNNNNSSTRGVVAPYPELDLRLAWHATKWLEISVVGQNLLQERHAEAGFPGPAQEEIVRSVYGKLTLQF